MKKVTLVLAVVLIVILWVGSGCKVTDSSDVNPNSIYPIYSVIRETGVSGIAVCAKLRLGGPYGVVVELDNGERLYCNYTLLGKVHGLFDVTYETTLYSAPASEYVFRFDRNGEIIDSIIGSLPPVPTISLAAGINEGDSMNVQWNTGLGTGEEIWIYVVINSTGSFTSFGPLTDNGLRTVSATSLSSLVRYLDPGDHTLRVEVARRDLCGVNSYFQKGGQGLAESIDVRTITYHKTSLAASGVQTLQLGKNIQDLKALKMGDNFRRE